TRYFSVSRSEEITQAPFSFSFTEISSSSLVGARIAGPVTGPRVPADQALNPMVSGRISGAIILADQGPRSKPTGNDPHSSSRALRPIFSNSLRVHSQAWVSLVELVSLGP